jgi:23S rRNA (uracil1939-C5)-methyltransferase
VLVKIEKPIYGGSFLTRLEGKAVFVPLVLPGEQALVRIVEGKRGYAKAEVEEIAVAAAERIAPRCPHFGACGGCNYQHATYEQQLGLKQEILRETLVRAGVEPPEDIEVLAGEPWQYRNRIRLALDGQGNLGYRGRRSHAIVPIAECPIAAPLLFEAAKELAQSIRTMLPSLRATEISLFCDRDETALLASIISAQPTKMSLAKLGNAVKERVPALLGIEVVTEDRAGQQQTLAQWGAPSLTYRAAGFDYRVDHGAFFQVNRWLVDELVECVTRGRSGGLAWDLFAGVGLFARQLAGGFERVVAVEVAPPSRRALEANLAGTCAAPVHASTLEFLSRSQTGPRPDLIVVDPPRTGLGPETTALLAAIGAPTITYVSCDPATLGRDLKALLASGYAIESLTLADLFPQTYHLETIAKLTKR